MDELNVIYKGRDLIVFESKGHFYASIDSVINRMIVGYVTCRGLYTSDGLDGYTRIITPSVVILHIWLYLFAWRRMTDTHEDYLVSIGLDFAKGTAMVLKLYLREVQKGDFVFGVNMFPYKTIVSDKTGSASSSSSVGKCDPAHIQVMVLSAFVHVFDIARFRQSIGMRTVYDDALVSVLTYIVCRIRHLYVRSRFEYGSSMRSRDATIEHSTPPDIKRLEDISIRLHLLFPCMPTCSVCHDYSFDGDILSMSTLSYSIAGQYVTPLIADIRRHVLTFDSS